MPEMHLRQPGFTFTYTTCDQFNKNKEKIKKIEAGDSRYIYQNKLDKACFEHDMVYGNFKDLHRATAACKVLGDKVFGIVKNTKYDGYQTGLASMVYKFFDKRNFWQRY